MTEIAEPVSRCQSRQGGNVEILSLAKLCREITGVQPSLGAQVFDLMRIRNPWPPILLEKPPQDLVRRVTKSLMRRVPASDYRRVKLVARGADEEDLYDQWQQTRLAYAHGWLGTARLRGMDIRERVRDVSTSFGRRLRIHADALILDTEEDCSWVGLHLRIERAHDIWLRYCGEKDFLSAAIASLREALLYRTIDFLYHRGPSKYLKEAVKISGEGAEILKAKCHRGFEAYEVGRVMEVAAFQRVRLLDETNEVDVSDELTLLRDLAPQAEGGLGILELLRAEAGSHSSRSRRSLRDRERSIQKTAEACFVYDHAPWRSPVTFFSLLGRVLDWCVQSRIGFTHQDLSPTTLWWEENGTDTYMPRLNRLFRATCQNRLSWLVFSAPACYVSRMSSFYVDPRLTRT
jgi:hypothetical protein